MGVINILPTASVLSSEHYCPFYELKICNKAYESRSFYTFTESQLWEELELFLNKHIV